MMMLGHLAAMNSKLGAQPIQYQTVRKRDGWSFYPAWVPLSSPSLSTSCRLPWQQKLHHQMPLWLPTELMVRTWRLINICDPLFKRVCNRISNSVKLPGMLWNYEVIGNQWREGNKRLCIYYPWNYTKQRKELRYCRVFSFASKSEYVVGCRLDRRLWSHISHTIFAIKKAL